MWSWIRRLVAPPVFEDDAEKTNAAQILNGVVWFNIMVWVLVLGALPFTEYPYLGLGIVSGLMLFAIGVLLALHRGHVQAVGQGFVVFLWIATSALIALSGGINNPETSGFVIVIMAAGLLLGIRSAIFYASLTLLSAVGIYITEINGLLPQLIPMEPFISVVVTWINILGITGIFYLALSSLEKALRSARTNEDKLAENNITLQMLAASLEDQVVERTASAESAKNALEIELWQISQLAQINNLMRGEQDIVTLAANVIKGLCQALDVQVGALFLREEQHFKLIGSYAFSQRKQAAPQFGLGEGLGGQAALEKQILVLDEVPVDYMPIQTGLFEGRPRQITAIPFLFDDQVLGVIEIASLEPLTTKKLKFLQRFTENAGIAFGTALARMQVNNLLRQTQEQAEQLSVREEELRSTNTELKIQSDFLRTSQEKLQAQQAHLEVANAELEEKTQTLQEQRTILDQQNRDLRIAQHDLQTKAEELTLANRYKSEFLANMSHELRTPLNSLLILARMLADNTEGNLTEDQIKSAQVIYNSGSDLLNLINDILDLSKVEAGRMAFHFEQTALTEITEILQVQFAPVSAEKNLPLEVIIDPDLPKSIETDSQRLRQIVKNLLSNAFKFTESGTITLRITRPAASPQLEQSHLTRENAIAIQVRDTGIGIPAEKQQQIFEAFQQADGSTSRRYGGTGLGLAIVREMALHLGGFVTVESQPNEGSVFSVIVPIKQDTASPESRTHPQEAAAPQKPLSRSAPSEVAVQPKVIPSLKELASPASETLDHPLQPGEKLLLVIEDDPTFADILKGFAQKKGFRCLSTPRGENGLDLVRRYKPQAIILDLNLPGISGWDVLEALKNDPELRHIPVHIMSAENENIQAYQRGVIGFLTKPVSPESLNEAFSEIETFIERQIKTLLLIEDDSNTRHSIIQLLSGADVEITEAWLGQAALDLLKSRHFDCIILDLSLPDMSGFELLENLHHNDYAVKSPIIVYTGRDLSEEENHQLMRYADSVIVKGVKSPERLLDETALFLHRVVADLSIEKQKAIQKLYQRDEALRGKKILIVDDDMRNSFALSRLLSERDLKVEIAPNGQRALEMLEQILDIELVLMDVMMPVMDGLETTQRIRQNPRFKNLPILALTAKAMKGDREQCLAAGANDYLSKPVDPDRLFTMLRVWLYN